MSRVFGWGPIAVGRQMASIAVIMAETFKKLGTPPISEDQVVPSEDDPRSRFPPERERLCVTM